MRVCFSSGIESAGGEETDMSILSEKGQVSRNGRVVVYEPFTPQFATIMEYDRNGLTFIHRGRELHEMEKISLDLFFTDGDTVVTDLPCKVVSEVLERREAPFAMGPAWKCRVRFTGLKKRKHAELMGILGLPPLKLEKSQ
jgi:hypothetical protein